MNRFSSLKLALLLAAFTLSALAKPDERPVAFDLLQSGKADEALRSLNERIQKKPDDAQAYNLLSRVQYQLEHWEDAIHASERAVALSPQNSEYHQWLARSYGRKAEASGPIGAFSLVRKVKNEFERAVALDPGNLSADTDMAEFYIEAPSFMGGSKTKARDLADLVTKRDPALGHYMHGQREAARDKSRAEREYKAAVEASDNAPRYWVSLAAFYRHTGRLDDMQSAVDKSLALTRQDGVALFDGAWLLLGTGRNFPTAIEMLRRYLASGGLAEDGPAFQAHYLLGALYEKQGDRPRAAGEYRAALALASQYRPAQDALARVSR